LTFFPINRHFYKKIKNVIFLEKPSKIIMMRNAFQTARFLHAENAGPRRASFLPAGRNP